MTPFAFSNAVNSPAYKDYLAIVPDDENVAKNQKAMVEGDEGRRIVYTRVRLPKLWRFQVVWFFRYVVANNGIVALALALSKKS